MGWQGLSLLIFPHKINEVIASLSFQDLSEKENKRDRIRIGVWGNLRKHPTSMAPPVNVKSLYIILRIKGD